jgi:hypothetical protein
VTFIYKNTLYSIIILQLQDFQQLAMLPVKPVNLTSQSKNRLCLKQHMLSLVCRKIISRQHGALTPCSTVLFATSLIIFVTDKSVPALTTTSLCEQKKVLSQESKGKDSCAPWRHTGESRGLSSTQHCKVAVGQLHGPAALLPGNSLRYWLNRRLDGPHSRYRCPWSNHNSDYSAVISRPNII